MKCKVSMKNKDTYREAHIQKQKEYPDLGLGGRETEQENRIQLNGRGIGVRLIQE